jgi:hypothetical protein
MPAAHVAEGVRELIAGVELKEISHPLAAVLTFYI